MQSEIGAEAGTEIDGVDGSEGVVALVPEAGQSIQSTHSCVQVIGVLHECHCCGCSLKAVTPYRIFCIGERIGKLLELSLCKTCLEGGTYCIPDKILCVSCRGALQLPLHHYLPVQMVSDNSFNIFLLCSQDCLSNYRRLYTGDVSTRSMCRCICGKVEKELDYCPDCGMCCVCSEECKLKHSFDCPRKLKLASA